MRQLTFNQVLTTDNPTIMRSVFLNKSSLACLPVCLLNIEGNAVDLIAIQREEVDPLLFDLNLRFEHRIGRECNETLPSGQLGGIPT